MVEFPHLRLVYCNVPRTGSNQIRGLLTGFNDDNQRLVPTPGFRCKYHGTAWYPEFYNHRIMLSIRHPYCRVLSLWAYFKTVIYEYDHPGSSDDARIEQTAARRNWGEIRDTFDHYSLTEFLQHPRMRFNLSSEGPWSAETCYKHLPRKPDIIIRLECLKEDLKQVLSYEPDVEDPINKSFATASWRQYISEPQAEEIRKLLAFEFEEFGYNPNLEEVKQGKYFLAGTNV